MNLSAWLRYIESLHPSEMELGLERVQTVAQRLELDLACSKVISVAGTNGKGSCVAVLEGLLLAQGLRVGAYTSPHLHRFNERIRVAGKEVTEQLLCDTFSRIESARGETRLTYFEFATLAALCVFQQGQLDVVVLEVGLGGRLDAVNIMDCDVAVVTSIDLDHMEWLGETREAIAREKAGIIRPGMPLVCADRNPPITLMEAAEKSSAPVSLIGCDFDSCLDGDKLWNWKGMDKAHSPISLSQLKNPVLHIDIVAAALQVLSLLGLLQDETVIREAIAEIDLAGRFDQRFDSSRSRHVLFDVAHNPAAARLLANRLLKLKTSHTQGARIILVLALMADKDVVGFTQALASAVDIWYIAQVDQKRCMAASVLAVTVAQSVDSADPLVFENALDAYQAACAACGPEDIVVVTGSFYIVAEILNFLEN